MVILDKKRLVFSFYLTNNWRENSINLFHIKLLSRYMMIFDESIFCMIIDDDVTIETIRDFQRTIIGISNGCVTFKTYPNTNYRESYVLYNEIATKLDELDGLTFFAHNKGISDTFGEENVKMWIAALYFFSFEVELPNNWLNGPTMYGPLKSVGCNYKYTYAVQNKFDWSFCGTFYWLKGQQIAAYLRHNNMEVPKLINRWYSEMFPGNIMPEDEAWAYYDIVLEKEDIEGARIGEIIERLYYGHDVLFDFRRYFEEVKN